jgi:hypothetical protein
VIWRAGLDLNPLHVDDDDDVRWLECLVWPGETGRRERLAAAIETARRAPPPLYRGDLVTDTAAVAGKAPAGATLVIYHSAVLAYLTEPQRRQFAELARTLDAVWISNEASGVLPGIAPPEAAALSAECFVLAKGGTHAIALTDGHGTWLEWLA